MEQFITLNKADKAAPSDTKHYVQGLGVSINLRHITYILHRPLGHGTRIMTAHAEIHVIENHNEVLHKISEAQRLLANS